LFGFTISLGWLTQLAMFGGSSLGTQGTYQEIIGILTLSFIIFYLK